MNYETNSNTNSERNGKRKTILKKWLNSDVLRVMSLLN